MHDYAAQQYLNSGKPSWQPLGHADSSCSKQPDGTAHTCDTSSHLQNKQPAQPAHFRQQTGRKSGTDTQTCQRGLRVFALLMGYRSSSESFEQMH